MRIFKNAGVLAIVAAVLAGAACGKKEEDTAADFAQGTWMTGCTAKGDGTYVISSLVIAEKTIAMSQVASSQPDCTAALYQSTLGGTFEVGGAASGVDGAVEFTTSLTAGTITVQDQTIISAFNQTAKCGYSDWAVNVEKSIVNCGEIFNSRQYTIVKVVESASPQTLQLGDCSADAACTEPTKRASALETTIFNKN